MLTNYPYYIQEQVVRSIREFFYAKKFHEVIPPVFTDTIPLEPNLYPFISQWHPEKKTITKYLATSPERSLKLALAQGMGNCFAIGHSFRDLEGSGPIHSPEFLMLEWYREDAVYIDIMKDAQALVLYIANHIPHPNPLLPPLRQGYEGQAGEGKNSHATVDSPFSWQEKGRMRYAIDNRSWSTFSLVNLFQTHTHLSIEQITQGEILYAIAKEKGYATKDATWSLLFDQIFLNEIEPHLPKTPFFLIDFPSRISPLCKPRADKPYLAERFELYINGMELGNGNTENTDAAYVREVFRVEREERKRRHLPCPPEDGEFLSALEIMQARSYAGIGLGVDRLCLLLHSFFSQSLPTPPTHASVGGVPRSGHVSE